MLSISHVTPLCLFRRGYDTLHIAEILQCSEATAERLVHEERDMEILERMRIRQDIRRKLEDMIS